MLRNVDHSRRVKPVDDVVSEIFQDERRGTFRKIMKVRVLTPATDHAFLAKQMLHGNVEREMN